MGVYHSGAAGAKEGEAITPTMAVISRGLRVSKLRGTCFFRACPKPSVLQLGPPPKEDSGFDSDAGRIFKDKAAFLCSWGRCSGWEGSLGEKDECRQLFPVYFLSPALLSVCARTAPEGATACVCSPPSLRLTKSWTRKSNMKSCHSGISLLTHPEPDSIGRIGTRVSGSVQKEQQGAWESLTPATKDRTKEAQLITRRSNRAQAGKCKQV